MFGYIAINKPEMKFKEFDIYQSYYCGFCRALKLEYGKFGQLTLSYDLTFLIILLTSLYDTEDESGLERCMAHPLNKHQYRYNEYSSYAADMNILLSYYKCLDDWMDEHKYSKKLTALNLKHKVDKIANKYPEKADKIEAMLDEIHEIEKNREQGIDKASGCFGQIMAEIFAIKEDIWENDLRRMGFYLGKFIYLMDAYEDIEKDKQSGNYNPFLFRYESNNFTEECESILTMMMAECSKAFEKLPAVENIEILRNILYSGVWCRYEALRAKGKEIQDV